MAQSFYKGIDSYVVYAEDTAFGTPGTPTGTDYIDKVSSFTSSITNNLIRVQEVGAGRNASDVVNGNVDVTGSINWFVSDVDFLQYLFVGIVSGSGTIGDPFLVTEANEFGYTAGQVNTLTLEVGSNGGSNDDKMTYDGVVFNTFTINANQGEVINISADWVGRTVNSSTSILTYTPPSDRPFTFVDSKVSLGSDVIGQVQQFTLTCNNNNQIFRDLGSRIISQPVAGVRRYEFNITLKLNYDDSASVLSGLEARSMVFDGTTISTTPTSNAQNTANTLNLSLIEGATSGDRVVNFNLSNVYFESISEPIEIGDSEAGLVEVTIAGYALSGTTNIPMQWYLVV